MSCENEPLVCLGLVYTVFFGIVNTVEKVNPVCLPISLFDELLNSHRYIISNFIFQSNISHFIAAVTVSKNSAFGTN